MENGENWEPDEPERRGRHPSFASAVSAAVDDILRERNEFFDSLADRWQALFPALAARPGRYSDGRIILYVKSAPALFSIRPRLASIRRTLLALPGAPKKIDLTLEIHK